MPPSSVLLVLSTHTTANDTSAHASASSFIACYRALVAARLSLVVATPDGAIPSFHYASSSEQHWMTEHAHLFSSTAPLSQVAASKFCALVLPDAPGALHDLRNNSLLGALLLALVTSARPVCAIGHGVAGLLSARAAVDSAAWLFANWSLTGCTVAECVRERSFARQQLVVEDALRERGAAFAASQPHCTHVVVDRTLVTAQNAESSALAARTLCFLLADANPTAAPTSSSSSTSASASSIASSSSSSSSSSSTAVAPS